MKAGASIINDISGLRNDEKIARLAAKHDCYLILMHMRGIPKTMQDDTRYDDLIGEITDFLKESAAKAMQMKVSKDKIIIDPGIGFGKSTEQNFAILKNLHRFTQLDFPLLVGASRKSFIGKALDVGVDHRLEGSLAAICYAVLNGADIVRVHDIPETKQAITIIENICAAEKA